MKFIACICIELFQILARQRWRIQQNQSGFKVRRKKRRYDNTKIWCKQSKGCFCKFLGKCVTLYHGSIMCLRNIYYMLIYIKLFAKVLMHNTAYPVMDTTLKILKPVALTWCLIAGKCKHLNEYYDLKNNCLELLRMFMYSWFSFSTLIGHSLCRSYFLLRWDYAKLFDFTLGNAAWHHTVQ